MRITLRSWRWVIYSLLIIAISFWLINTHSQETTQIRKGYLLKVDGAIGPAIQDYLEKGIKKATQENGKLVIIQMNTPGGLAKSMRGIILAILESPIPIIGYVAPSGAHAASAGTFILYATHIAAMAPGTNLGAASPVSIGSPGGSSPADKKKTDKKTEKKDTKSTLEKKVTSDASAYIRSLAQLRGRNAKWAEKAVTKAVSLSATEALKENVINLIAYNIPDLLNKINGKTVKIDDREVALNTQNLTLENIKPNWRIRLLSIITDPTIAYILLLVGIYGIFFEFANPGLVGPGVIGAICLLLAAYALQLLPINYAGLGLMLLGIAFMIAEAFLPSFGILGIGGVIAFVVGSILLLDTKASGFRIAWPIIAAITIVTAAFFFLVVNMALRARFRKVVSGREELMGSTGTVFMPDKGNPRIRVRGEMWQVTSDQTLSPGQRVKVVGREGMILKVVPDSEDVKTK